MNQLTKAAKTLAAKYNSTSLILRIAIGLVIGSVLALICPGAAWIEEFGNLFVGALKGVAPVLVFVIVASALAQGSSKLDRRFGTVVWLYMLTTFVAAALSVATSKLYPQTLVLAEAATADVVPQGLGDVMHTLLSNIVSNPVASIMNGNYIGILMWACLFGLAMKKLGSDTTKNFMANTADAISTIVRWIINLAPFGIMGLVFTNVSDNGLSIFTQYGRLLLLLVGTMLLMALVINPFIIFIYLHRNPYPLVFRCLRESGLTAFFTRSSAANIPVNMSLCEKLGLDKDIYSVSIPLGATINMDGAAITITIMTLAAANTLGMQVSVPAAILLSIMSALGACGASGVAGGSLLLIPMACSLFGISNDIAMQVVGVGFIIGVIQDSVETALNSAGDVEFAATAEYHQWLKEGKPVFYYTWTPYWVSNELKPGKDVVWLQVPFSALPGDKNADTKLPNGANYGFPVSTMHIVANKAWAEKNPAAAKLFAIMQLPVADINAQNAIMHDGKASEGDIQGHVDGWIKAHQQQFDGWVNEALAAQK